MTILTGSLVWAEPYEILYELFIDQIPKTIRVSLISHFKLKKSFLKAVLRKGFALPAGKYLCRESKVTAKSGLNRFGGLSFPLFYRIYFQ